MTRHALASHRSRLLTCLAGLVLIVLASLPAAASRQVAEAAGDTVVAAVSHVADAARTAPERLTPAQRSGLDRRLPPSAAVPPAVLLASLLAVRRRRAVVVVTTPRPLLLRAAGRGPPVTS